MKVGILTIFRTGNYGGTLQAYALQQAIQENGFAEAEIINYSCNSVKQKIDMDFLRKAGLFRTAVACAEKIYYYPRVKKVYAFVDSFVPGKELTKAELPSLNDQYDMFLSGSDQIWNPDIQQGDYSYLLDFVKSPEKKRSYASSFGTQKIADEYVAQYRELLNQYQRIAVRESNGQKLVKELTGREADLVIDPVLLLSPEQWEAKLPEPKYQKGYVFAYQLAHSPLIAEIVSKAAKEKHLKAIFVPFPILGVCKCRPVLNLSSLEWVRAIHDADYVIADSFHAAVFSILFKKPFYYVITSDTVRNRLSRLETLLGTLGLEDRMVDSAAQCDFDVEIDYEEVHRKLAAERERCLGVLKELGSE